MNTSPPHPDRSRDGSVLFMIMVVLGALSFVGGTIFLITRTDLSITRNYKTEIEAFQNADAGVQYVKDQVDAALSAKTLTLLAATETVNYTAPAGFDFDPITELIQLGNTNAYMFTVTGNSQDSEATIEAVIHRLPQIQYGLFGDEQVDLKPNANVYSYDSTFTPNPTPGDSTGHAATASNEEFISGNGSYIDGSLVLGEDTSGNQAVWMDKNGGATITGYEGQEVSHIDPDPLGATSGDLAAEFTTISTVNDNASASPAIAPPQNKINLGNGDTMTLTAGDYFVESASLGNGATLDIDASGGPVNIYLTGKWEAKNGSNINFPANTTGFNMYSNSSEPIIFKHNGDMSGMVYAPDAFVEVKNSANFYGTVWSQTAEVKNSGDVYIDIALLNRWWSDSVYLASWKEVRY